MLKSVMTHQFSEAPSVDCARSRLDRSCGCKTTFDSGYLVPFFCDEVLPGDTFDVDATIFARLSTPIVPFMDNLFLDTFFFFVPLRLLWSNFEKFMGEQENPDDSTDYICPTITAPAEGFAEDSLFDYIGLPTKVGNIKVNSFFPRAYNRIWNEWFRDENLQESVVKNMSDGPDDIADYNLLRRGKRHDYFTSALPWPQKGPAVDLPLGVSAPVYGNGQPISLTNGTNSLQIGVGRHTSNPSYMGVLFKNASTTSSVGDSFTPLTTDTTTKVLGFVNKTSSVTTGLYTDLSEATAATINSIRQAFQLQKYYERDARGGTRYIEKIFSHFGVKSPDGRLQRTEYLGGRSQRINVNQVQQQSGTPVDNSGTPLGTLGAYGYVATDNNGFVRSFTEHGLIIGLVNVRADLTYQQGIDRMFLRSTVVDFYWPSFAHLGEQPIYNKEIFAQGTSEDDDVFGYQERYAEYRYKPSKITGKFRSNATGSLDVWHLSQDFDSLPTLSSDFIEDNPPLERVLAVQDEPQILFDSYIKNICIRPIPVYSIPGNVDHF